jgi:hypothetical protein
LRISAAVLLATLALPLCAAEVYRSQDADGTVVYSDRPAQGSERVFVATPRISSTPRQPVTSDRATTAAESSQPEVLSGQIRVERTPEEVAAEKERNCAAARERADRYSVSQRLFRTLPNGEREYLSDAELDEARAKADADVANWCG